MIDDVAELALDLARATDDTMRKVNNIMGRAAVELRENWKERATAFPSPTNARSYPYAIDYPGIDSSGGTVSVTVGSDDPLLAVIEYGGATRAPANHGKAALDYAAGFAADALQLMGPLTRAKK